MEEGIKSRLTNDGGVFTEPIAKLLHDGEPVAGSIVEHSQHESIKQPLQNLTVTSVLRHAT
jgi:hypothetical protein